MSNYCRTPACIGTPRYEGYCRRCGTREPGTGPYPHLSDYDIFWRQVPAAVVSCLSFVVTVLTFYGGSLIATCIFGTVTVLLWLWLSRLEGEMRARARNRRAEDILRNER